MARPRRSPLELYDDHDTESLIGARPDDDEKRRKKYGSASSGGPSWADVMSTVGVVLGVIILVLMAIHFKEHRDHADTVEDYFEETCDPTAPVLFWGNDLSNSNYRSCDPINSENVDQLGLHCYANVGASVSAKPTVYAGVAYFPSWENIANPALGGHLHAVYVDTCQEKWRFPISAYTGIDADVARVSPAIDPKAGRYVILGSGQGANAGGAFVFAVNTTDGSLVWKTQVHDHEFAVITTSMVIDNDLVWGGVASREEAAAASPLYECCSFKGSAFLLSANTGAFLNEFVTAQGNVTGNAIWSSTPVVDHISQRACFTTGNNYDYGDEATIECEETTDDLDSLRECLVASGNLVNSFFCVDETGFEFDWALPVTGVDAWTVACIVPGNPGGNCPEYPGPDYDFGQGPMLGEVHNHAAGHITRRALFAGQKSGIFWAVDLETGDILWSNQVAPGASLGGFEWGSAYSEELGIFASNANRDYADYQTPVIANYQYGTVPFNTTTCSGSWVRLDKDTGRVLWMTIDPYGVIGETECDELRAEVFPAPELKQSSDAVEQKAASPFYQKMAAARKGTRNAPGHAEGPLAYALGPVSVVNDVMFAGSMTGFIYGMDANDGKIKFEYDTGGSYNTAPAIWNGHVITGSGYERFGLGEAQEYLYVFKVGGTTPSPFAPV